MLKLSVLLFRLNWTKMTATQQSVQVYGRKKTATAVAHCRSGQGLIKVNGKPLDQIEPKPLQYKLQEPLLVVGKGKFKSLIFIDLLKTKIFASFPIITLLT